MQKVCQLQRIAAKYRKQQEKLSMEEIELLAAVDEVLEACIGLTSESEE